MRWTVALMATLLGGGPLGCGGEERDPCAGAPTFAQDVAPIAQAKCTTCHAPGASRRGAPQDLNFQDWASVMPVVEAFADAITSGRQPPLGFQPAVTREERALVGRWRTCGFRE